jgi:hypothetical protein
MPSANELEPSEDLARQREQLQALTRAIVNTYGTTRQLLWRSFLGGLFSAVGATVGFALIVMLVAFLIKDFGGLPVVGQWLQDVGKSLPRRGNGG